MAPGHYLRWSGTSNAFGGDVQLLTKVVACMAWISAYICLHANHQPGWWLAWNL